MSINASSVSAITSLVGVSGREGDVLMEAERRLTMAGARCEYDSFGNLCVTKGNPDGITFYIHVDTPGFYTTYIERDGKVRIGAVGDIKPMQYTQVISERGVRGVLVKDSYPTDRDENSDDPNSYYIDIGRQSASESAKYVSISDTFVFRSPVVRMGTRLMGFGLSDRIFLCIILDLIENTDISGRFVFTVQHRAGSRGEHTAVYNESTVDENGISVFLGSCYPESARCDDGVLIITKGDDIISDLLLSKNLFEYAKESSVKTKLTASAKLSRFVNLSASAGNGTRALSLSIPAERYTTPCESISLQDVREAQKLIEIICRDGKKALKP
ncbi:MAG: hypothetical protein SOZ62_04730 [Eubacteriales bacterium]|nr:hypothetical protein [Eubacteriales bacterium]